MKLSQKGREFIKSHEGLELEAYQCSAGVWTIGYGHTVGITKGMIISQDEADAYFGNDIEVFEQGVSNLVKVPLTQNQFDALVSLAFNIGIGAFGKSTLLKKLNKGDYTGAQAQFAAWCKAGGKTNQGLLKRRLREAELFGRGSIKEQRPNDVRKPDTPRKPTPAVISPTNLAGAGVAVATVTSTVKEAQDSIETLGDAVKAFCASPQLYLTIGILCAVGFILWRNYQNKKAMGL